ncbi:GNAT family N-acetyltransferase [Solwaraspora sp. WMMB335]|uniref:GNAT family N-acetyltransferase n=1 Tax=Solwaraspora sp. WMMB335 TaxID=3404118 RepID=UPI003B94FAE3
MNQRFTVRPSDLTARDLPQVDRQVLDELVGPARMATMAQAGMAMGNPDAMPIDALIGAVEAGICRSWIMYAQDPLAPGQDQAVAFIMYAPFSIPGVWAGEVIRTGAAPHLRGVGFAAMAYALDLIFADPAARRVIGFVSVRNEASVAMVDRLGYHREGLARRLMSVPDPQAPGGVADEVDAWLYRMHRDDWAGAATLEARDWPGAGLVAASRGHG